jgi:alkanesulfonate monooxygenase
VSVELIGVLSPEGDADAGTGRPGRPAQPGALQRLLDAHEAAGFDRVLIPAGPPAPESHLIAAYAAVHTARLGLLVEHRPGLAQPSVAARALATLDQFSGGRLAVFVPVCAPENERRRDGDFLPQQDVPARDREYLQLLRRTWTAREPIDAEGRFYRFEHYVNNVPPVHGRIPVYVGGEGVDVAQLARQEADVLILPASAGPAGTALADPAPAAGAGRAAFGVTVELSPGAGADVLVDHLRAGATTLILHGYEFDGRLRALLAEVRAQAGAGRIGETIR